MINRILPDNLLIVNITFTNRHLYHCNLELCTSSIERWKKNLPSLPVSNVVEDILQGQHEIITDTQCWLGAFWPFTHSLFPTIAQSNKGFSGFMSAPTSHKCELVITRQQWQWAGFTPLWRWNYTLQENETLLVRTTVAGVIHRNWHIFLPQ